MIDYQTPRAIALLCAVELVLSGCGGGGGGGGGSSPSTVPTASYSIGGSVSGLATGQSLTLVDNGTDQLVVQNNGNYSFSTKISSGGVYKVTIGAQPNGQTCSLANGTGSGSGITADVTNTSVVCSNITYTVGGSLSGLASGTQVTLLNNGADSLTLTGNGPFSFATPIAYNGSYSVTIGSQPNGRSCSITGNSGAGAGVTSNIQTVIVVCSPPPTPSPLRPRELPSLLAIPSAFR